MPGSRYLIDSNILIRWVHPEGPEFQVANRAIHRLEETDDQPCYTSQIWANSGMF